MEKVIEIKDVSKKIGTNVILKDINLSFEKGKIYGIIGRNGSGKSMLLKVICGFLRPNTGTILVNNENIFEKNVFPKDMRALIEKPSFIPGISGMRNLELLAKIQNKIDKNQIKDVLSEVGLYKDKDKKFGEYSLGMKQKLGIACVLMENPKIIILDEPFNGIEKETVSKLRKTLINEKKRGKTIIIATHIKEDISILCDEVFEMDNGMVSKIKV